MLNDLRKEEEFRKVTTENILPDFVEIRDDDSATSQAGHGEDLVLLLSAQRYLHWHTFRQ